MIILISMLIICLLLLIASVVFGAVYMESVDWAVDDIVRLAAVKKGDRVVDLGSGNGKVVIALAKKGVEVHGYEINPLLVVWSLLLIRLAGVHKKAHIHLGNFFNVDLSGFQVVTIFVVPYIMKRIEQKLQKELKVGSRVVVESFPFPNWKPIKKTQSVYLYKKV